MIFDLQALNVGHDSTDPAQLAKAFSAAKSSAFKLFFSFDMNYFSKPGSSDAMLSDYLTKYGGHDAHFLYSGKVFVSTFSGEVAGALDTGCFMACSMLTVASQVLFSTALAAWPTRTQNGPTCSRRRRVPSGRT